MKNLWRFRQNTNTQLIYDEMPKGEPDSVGGPSPKETAELSAKVMETRKKEGREAIAQELGKEISAIATQVPNESYDKWNEAAPPPWDVQHFRKKLPFLDPEMDLDEFQSLSTEKKNQKLTELYEAQLAPLPKDFQSLFRFERLTRIRDGLEQYPESSVEQIRILITQELISEVKFFKAWINLDKAEKTAVLSGMKEDKVLIPMAENMLPGTKWPNIDWQKVYQDGDRGAQIQKMRAPYHKAMEKLTLGLKDS